MGTKRCAVSGRKLVFGAKLAVLLMAALSLAGCSIIDGGLSSSSSEVENLRADNEQLREDNEQLRAENERLRAEVADAQAGDEVEQVSSSPESVPEEDPSGVEQASSGGGNLTAAGAGEVSGEAVPEIMPEDFPLPSGAVLEYTNEDFYSFSLQFVLDTDLQSTTSFYEEQLQAGGWRESGRTEYEQDGLEGLDLTWERDTFIPEDSPQESAYKQNDERVDITMQEIQPSGVIVQILWNSGKLLDESDKY